MTLNNLHTTPLQESFILRVLFCCSEAANASLCNQVPETSHRCIRMILSYAATPEPRGMFFFIFYLHFPEHHFENCHTLPVLKIVHLQISFIIFCKCFPIVNVVLSKDNIFKRHRMQNKKW